MTLSPVQTLGIILAVAAGTQLTRWLPFWLFPEKKAPPPVVTYLGKVLPPAMMGLLVVYCLKSVSWLTASRGAGADRHRGGDGPPLVERQCAAVHRRRHGGVHAAGAGGIRVTCARGVDFRPRLVFYHKPSRSRISWNRGFAAAFLEIWKEGRHAEAALFLGPGGVPVYSGGGDAAALRLRVERRQHFGGSIFRRQ